MHSILDINTKPEATSAPLPGAAQAKSTERTSFKDSLKQQQAAKEPAAQEADKAEPQAETNTSEKPATRTEGEAINKPLEKGANVGTEKSAHYLSSTEDTLIRSEALLEIGPPIEESVSLLVSQDVLQNKVPALGIIVADETVPMPVAGTSDLIEFEAPLEQPLDDMEVQVPFNGPAAPVEMALKTPQQTPVETPLKKGQPLQSVMPSKPALSTETPVEISLPLRGEGEKAAEQAKSGFVNAGALPLQTKTSLESGLMNKSASLVEPIIAAVEEDAEIHKPTVSAPNFSRVLSESSELSPARMQMPVNISFGKPQWNTMVAERAAMMAAQNISTADLQLDPPELGPLQVRVQVNNDQVSVHFTSAHANVREALDQTATRLRELCEQQGMNLLDVNVSDQQQGSSQPQQQAAEGEAAQQEGEPHEPGQVLTFTASSGIDYYA